LAGLSRRAARGASELHQEGLHEAQEFNSQRYHYQGIGRFAPPAAYTRGLADLRVLANLVPANGYLHGAKPTSVDASIYGFIANIYFYPIDTPLKQFVASHANLVRHCTAIHAAVRSTAQHVAPTSRP
jgi:glutathione S-transferase